MIVDQFQTQLTGGAAQAALRLHRALLPQGVTSRLWYASKNPPTSTDVACEPVKWARQSGHPWQFIAAVAAGARRRLSLKREKRRYLRGRQPSAELFSRPRLWHDTPHDTTAAPADVIQLHWIAGLIDYPSFFGSVPASFPIVWTLHDMNPFTGGCHYSEGCQRYSGRCGDCPMLAHPSDNDLSRRSFQIKRDALRDKNLHVVTPSRWLAAEARRSAILASVKSFQVIPNGLDTTVFAPMNKRAAKKTLGLPVDRFVIGFGAESLAARRKGFPEFRAALEQLDTDLPVSGLAFGDGELPPLDHSHVELRSAGYVRDEARLAAVYSAADVFVVPSLEDNLPQTGIEALACGTPVVGFDIGGIPDFVRPHQTGLLATKGDATDLARQIAWMLQHPQACQHMSRQARDTAIREFTAERQAERYIEFYTRITAECTGRGHHKLPHRDSTNLSTKAA